MHEAFVLNVVENLQRRELSGRERVRALLLLAALTDESGRTLGVREISRRTGLATGGADLRSAATQRALDLTRSPGRFSN
jgi:hypothetical protein